MNHAMLPAEDFYLASARGIDSWPMRRTLTVLLIAVILYVHLAGHALILWGLGQFASIFMDRYFRR